MSLLSQIAPFLQNLQSQYVSHSPFQHDIIVSFISNKRQTFIELDLEIINDEVRFSSTFCLIGAGVGVGGYIVYRFSRWFLPSCLHLWQLCYGEIKPYNQDETKTCSCCGNLWPPPSQNPAVRPTNISSQPFLDSPPFDWRRRGLHRSQDHGFFSSYPTLSDLCLALPEEVPPSLIASPNFEEYFRKKELSTFNNVEHHDWFSQRFHSTPDYMVASCDDQLLMQTQDAVFDAETPRSEIFDKATKLGTSTLTDMDLLQRQLNSVTDEVDAMSNHIEQLRARRPPPETGISRDSLEGCDEAISRSCYIPRTHVPTQKRLAESLDVLWDNEDGLFASRLAIFNDITPHVTHSPNSLAAHSKDLFESFGSSPMSSPERELPATLQTAAYGFKNDLAPPSCNKCDGSVLFERRSIFDSIETALSANKRNISMAYYEVSKHWGVGGTRAVHSDGHSVMRATIFQALLHSPFHPDMIKILKKIITSLGDASSATHSFLARWSFADRTNPDLQSQQKLAQECLLCLLNNINRLSEIKYIGDREQYLSNLLNSDLSLDFHLIQATKLLIFFNLTSLYRGYLCGERGNTLPFLLPLFSFGTQTLSEEFFVKYLNECGVKRHLNITDIFLLALSLQIKIEVIRPGAYPRGPFVTHYPDEGVDSLLKVSIIQHPDDTYALLLA